MDAKVIKILGTSYTVLVGNQVCEATPRGNLRQNGRVYVGDNVVVITNDYGKGYVIDKVLPRTNCLVRPPVANVDQLIIVASISPTPDFELIDKLMLYCLINNIAPVLVINKCDLSHGNQILDIMDQYKYCTDKIFAVSALHGQGLQTLSGVLRGKVSAFAGQSAVGKSTLVNALTGSDVALTNGLSAKTMRGKHTTRHTEIHLIGDDIMIADTAGFSMFDLNGLDPDDLKDYYPDFAGDKCAYSGCSHINCSADDCSVVADVQEGVINRNRYERYVKLYGHLRDQWRRKYD